MLADAATLAIDLRKSDISQKETVLFDFDKYKSFERLQFDIHRFTLMEPRAVSVATTTRNL